MHVAQTISETPPFTHTVDNVTMEEIDTQKLKSFTSENVESFSKVCYEEYKKRYPEALYGSVDVNPTIWTVVVINNLQKEKPFEFPNGCCTRKICSINLFYEIVLEQLASRA